MKERGQERQEGGWRLIREEDETGERLRGGKQGNRAVMEGEEQMQEDRGWRGDGGWGRRGEESGGQLVEKLNEGKKH